MNIDSQQSALEKITTLVVLKNGSNLLMDDENHFNRNYQEAIAAQIREIRKQLGETVAFVIVSSGAVAAGRDRAGKNRRLMNDQALAALGQPLLMKSWDEAFIGQTEGEEDILVAQALVTKIDFASKRRRKNIRDTLASLLATGVIPILNENDTVCVEELKYVKADATQETREKTAMANDALSAMVTEEVLKMFAELNLTQKFFILASDVDGVYDKNPRGNPDAILYPEISIAGLEAIDANGKGENGAGGMETKIGAAKTIKSSYPDCRVFVLNGNKPNFLTKIVLEGENPGSEIVAA
ncbi:MAG: hypothetical protein PHO48_03975 [Candidatus Gracilibacteria bacterium]|nr:hypothetical protein [Candidatus Gracilibacteria bacterium]MDD5179466.1 hypothetical protein [Candidatus Gracilibacteria bacterium]